VASGPKSAPVEGPTHELFGFLTTEANAIVAPIHSKAMPVILTTTVALRLNVRFALVYEHHCS
jgi:putative SOS response-associated peptidase YedK